MNTDELENSERAGWMRLLKVVYAPVNIYERMDSIDIDWELLPSIFEMLGERQSLVLRCRFFEQLTLKETAKRVPSLKPTRRRPCICAQSARSIEMRALRKLWHRDGQKVVNRCIVGYWRLLK